MTTVQVGSQASGTISALYADFNSVVKKGQVVAQLDPADAKAQVDQARANLEQARASLAQARAAVTEFARRRQRCAGASSRGADRQCKTIRPACRCASQRRRVESATATTRSAFETAGVVNQSGRDCAARIRHCADRLSRPREARYNQAVAQLNQAKLSEQIGVECGHRAVAGAGAAVAGAGSAVAGAGAAGRGSGAAGAGRASVWQK